MTALLGDLHAASGWLLVAAVIAVGVLHTAVPDHWVPITLLARQQGWSRIETARAAAKAGTGHVLSTLLIGIVVWIIGVSAGRQFGGATDAIASLALVLFGGWCFVIGLMELLREEMHQHGHDQQGRDQDRSHPHCHDRERATHIYIGTSGAAHTHIHAHSFATAHPVTAAMAFDPPLHEHNHSATGRFALLIILGSSPMIEGIPAFFAASRLGIGFMVVMSVLFAASTIATYVALCVYSVAGMERARLGPVERYGEVLSGAFIAAIGLIFWVWPVL